MSCLYVLSINGTCLGDAILHFHLQPKHNLPQITGKTRVTQLCNIRGTEVRNGIRMCLVIKLFTYR